MYTGSNIGNAQCGQHIEHLRHQTNRTKIMVRLLVCSPKKSVYMLEKWRLKVVITIQIRNEPLANADHWCEFAVELKQAETIACTKSTRIAN